MNRPFVALALGLAGGLLVVLCVKAVRPAPVSLTSIHRRVQPGRPNLIGAPRPGAVTSLAEHLARTTMGRRLAERYGDDLFVAQTTLPQLLAQVLAFGAIGFLVAVALFGGLAAAGTIVSPVPVVGGALLLGLFGAAFSLQALRARAAIGRAAFRNAVSQYLTLCSSVMAGGRSAEWAVRYAAAAGEGRAFETINGALSSAPAMGRTTWEALTAVADEWKTPELGDLGASVERATVLGGDAADAAAVIAQAMRARSLDDIERRADRSNVKMLGPTYLFLGGFMLFLAFPLLDELSRNL